MDSQAMQYDVVIVGGGPSGLAAAIKLRQLAIQNNQELSVCLLEKGAKIGSHLLSGAVICPTSLKELLPNSWQNAPFNTPAKKDRFYYLTEKHAFRLPVPYLMKNHGHFIVSIDELCIYLAKEAEALGVEIYSGFPATSLLFDEKGNVNGVATGALGIDKEGNPTPQFSAGVSLFARQTIFAEGCRGQLTQELIQKYALQDGKNPQTYGLGIKEIWRIPKAQHQEGLVIHTVGWPMDQKTYGGSFIYHMAENKVALGFVVGLDYENPWLSPFSEMQRFKTHPMVSKLLKDGERLAYGARALTEGGFQSLPKLTFPGGALVGDCAGFLNVPRIKGIHTAIHSGILASQAIYQILQEENVTEAKNYSSSVYQSSLGKELYRVRNFRPGFKRGLFLGLSNAFLEAYVTFGHSPWTLKNHNDYTSLKPADIFPPMNYPKPDGKLTFDRLSSVYLTNTYHEENQPCHLVLKDPSLAINVNYKEYASPETRYCPAAVYEIIEHEGNPQLKINAQNCIHCKTCDIKDPRQNIIWKAPEGGGGPNYVDM